MYGVVVTGGEAPHISIAIEELRKADCIIAADSGLETLVSYGFDPDLVVGDMDSLRDKQILESIDREKVLIYPEDKDYTDTELAIEHLVDKGCDRIAVVGGGGGRLDHLIALYSLFSKEHAPDLWITDREKILLVKEQICITLRANTLVSLFPVGNELCTMTSCGLKWPLDELKWRSGDVGISNVAQEETILINMKSGKLVMMIPLENY